jgi:hypothetical protein
MARNDLTAQRLRELLHYDPDTGAFLRAGVFVGSADSGYLRIKIDGSKYQAHRLAWLYAYGKWPFAQIDHINGIGTDNRLANLRDVSTRVNKQNMRKARIDCVSCALGVSKDRGKWRSRINVNGTKIHLGIFDTIKEASDAYIRAKRALHTGCTI